MNAKSLVHHSAFCTQGRNCKIPRLDFTDPYEIGNRFWIFEFFYPTVGIKKQSDNYTNVAEDS